MATFVMLTRVSPDAIKTPETLASLGDQVADRLKAECPEANWIASYAVLGPYDYVDIFEAPSNDVASKVALVIRSFGHATTETWAAMPWEGFRDMVRGTGAATGQGRTSPS